MNQTAKRRVLKKLYNLEELVRNTIEDVEDCYEFGSRTGEFFQVGDLVGFRCPVFIHKGVSITKGEVKEVFPDKRKVNIYCRQHFRSYPTQQLYLTKSYDRIYLIKGKHDKEEDVAMPSQELNIEDVQIISVRCDTL